MAPDIMTFSYLCHDIYHVVPLYISHLGSTFGYKIKLTDAV